MSLPLAAFSASSALVIAAEAELLASPIPLWADLSTESSFTSVCCTRCCVFSTSAETASTFLLTSPTSRATYDFLAQPATARAASTAMHLVVISRPPSEGSRGRGPRLGGEELLDLLLGGLARPSVQLLDPTEQQLPVAVDPSDVVVGETPPLLADAALPLGPRALEDVA